MNQPKLDAIKGTILPKGYHLTVLLTSQALTQSKQLRLNRKAMSKLLREQARDLVDSTSSISPEQLAAQADHWARKTHESMTLHGVGQVGPMMLTAEQLDQLSSAWMILRASTSQAHLQ
jgi:hypothetical protein